MKIADHLYVYLWADARENNCNSVFIDGKIPLLIDPGHRHRVNDLLDRLNRDGVDPARIRLIICTHGHPDHFEGAEALRDIAPVRVAMSREEEEYIEGTGRPMYSQQGLAMPEYQVDFYLKDGDLVLGKHEFQILLTPGHSPGSLSIYWPRHKVLIVGDVVFAQGVGRVDFPGGDAKALRQSIDRLEKLSVELLIPGHGTALQGEDRVRKNFEYIKTAFLGSR
jgi:hydroxyacylglutathione hydrolase